MHIDSRMDRKGKPAVSKYTYRKGKESRMIYMVGYVEGQLQYGHTAFISKSWYKDKYSLSKSTLYKDIKGLSAMYPQIVWTK